MGYEVRVEQVRPRPLTAVRANVSRAQLGDEIRRLVGTVWPVLREQRVATGHNVVIYHGGSSRTLDIEAGVETPSGFAECRDVRSAATPAGEAVTTAHFGDYAQMHGAYAALETWCAAEGRRPSGVSWEVYGDWDDDWAKVRTDIYFLLTPS
jgi:effector-binding domain-containing protein